MVKKIKREIKNILNKFVNDCHFSFLLAMAGVLGSSFGRLVPVINQRCANYRNRFILKYMDRLLGDVTDKYRTLEEEGVYCENAPVWVCWWTGLEDAPELVKTCVKSIKNAAGDRPVNIITKYNFFEYLEIPEDILEKMESGKMCLANFADYIRVALLEKFGGLWLDATIYVPRRISADIFDRCVYTCKSPNAKGYFVNGRWTSYCIGGWKNHLLFKMAKESFEEYWKKASVSVDYLLLDYVFETIYLNNLFVKNSIDEIPINNMQRNDLAAAMVSGKPFEEFDNIITEETDFYKLSWREAYPLETAEGKDSIYRYFLGL